MTPDHDPECAAVPTCPGPALWVSYAVTGRLPRRYRARVLYDLGCPTWPLRHLARPVVPVVPVASILVLALPGPLPVLAAAVLMGSLIGLGYTFVFLHHSTDRRATKFGYPSSIAQRIRDQRARAQRHEPARGQSDREKLGAEQRGRQRATGSETEHVRKS